MQEAGAYVTRIEGQARRPARASHAGVGVCGCVMRLFPAV